MKMAGGALILVHSKHHMKWSLASLLVLAILTCGYASAQTLYKYRGENGEWIYSDRPPNDDRITEDRELSQPVPPAKVIVTYKLFSNKVELVAHNGFHAPMEIALFIDSIVGIENPHPDNRLRWVVPPRSDLMMLSLAFLDGAAVPELEYHFDYLPGDPTSQHQPSDEYRVPFSAGSSHPITQANPSTRTHRTLDSIHAVDIAMPVGTDVVAARDGIVFDAASNYFRAGLDLERDGQSANVLRILHDDGTYAIYAHLNRNTIRVKPGDLVLAGDYIADSGNTGFSSGPHLHFAVQRNAGMRTDSLPVVFKGPTPGGVVPETGNVLTAYP